MGGVIQNKQRILLYLIESLSGINKSSRFFIEKNLFLLKIEEHFDQYMKFYHFFPYMYGPFSNMSFMDINNLRVKGYLDDDETHPGLTAKGKQEADKVEIQLKNKVEKTIGRFNNDDEIKEYVYKKYPSYTVKSASPQQKITELSPGIFTIGYEGKDIDNFLDILIKKNIQVLVDVRKNPFSMNFSFTKSKLSDYLNKVGIEYMHIPELGIDGSQRKQLDTEEDYRKLFDEYKNTTLAERKQNISEIIKLGEKKRIALMCFEEDKSMCHRGVISEYLESNNVAVEHI